MKNWHYEPGDWHKAPNLISYIRALGFWVPALLIALAPHSPVIYWWALGVFVFVILTDFVDGKVARHFRLETDLGRFIDPLLDKLLVGTTLVTLTVLNLWLVPITLVILAREIIITLQLRNRQKLQEAIWSGKVKLWFQAFMLITLLVPLGFYVSWWAITQLIFALLALGWTTYSWVDYYQKFVRPRPPAAAA